MKFRLIKSRKKKPEDEKVKQQIDEAKKRREIYKLKKKKEKEKKRLQRKRHKLSYFLTKAGIFVDARKVSKRVFNIAIALNIMISAYLIYYFSTNMGYQLTYIILIIVGLWIFAFAVILFVLWMLLYVILDFKMMKRRLELEAVLPDFLQLTAANIKAGMPVDQALWYAVRPRFGILANEIELVAKETMSGEELDDALRKFSEKYDSTTLRRAISLIIEGIRAGGEIAELVMKISSDIQETKIMKKEMAASVTTYVIFIGFATVLASPFLFGLAGQLISIVKDLAGSMDMSSVAGSQLGISITGGGLKLQDFKIFSVVMLTVTSFFSAAIISTIQKGNIKEGIKFIPIFIITTLALYFIVSWGMARIFSGIF